MKESVLFIQYVTVYKMYFVCLKKFESNQNNSTYEHILDGVDIYGGSPLVTF